MTNIIPIHGLRLSPEAGLDYSQIITQPYDIISPEQQEEYYEKSLFNIIRLEYAKSLPGDDSSHNKYTRAAQTLQEWLSKGILYREETPALYLYEQHFSSGGRKYRRLGLFCGVELSSYEEGKIIPHEITMNKPKADRLELMNHCQANFSPVFGLYSDPKGFLADLAEKQENKKPIIDFSDDEGQIHRIRLITDPATIATAQDFFRDKKIFIADGHHRYETALEFYRQKNKESGDPQKYGHVLMVLVNIYDKGLLSFPTHRLVAQSGIDTKELFSHLETNFTLHELEDPRDKEHLQTVLESFSASAEGDDIFLGLYTEEKLYGLKLKNPEQFSFPLLDTFVLQKLILEAFFGLGEAEKDRADLVYLKDEWEAKMHVDDGKGCCVFYLNRPSVEKIIALAAKGIRMPQKTTYFYPKMISGLIMLKHT